MFFQNNLRYSRTLFQATDIAVKQWRNHEVWATKRKQKVCTDIALEYFDNIYGPVFGNRWPSMRLALLSRHKYCAVVNNFSDVDKICTQLQNEGAMNIREVFEVQQNVLSEKRNKTRRKNELKGVYNLDKRIEEIATRKRDEELEMIYPAGSEHPSADSFKNTSDLKEEENIPKEELIKQAKTPLDKSISEGTIDTSRQIDPVEGFSSNRLNEFVPVSQIKGKEGFVSEAEHFSFYYDPVDFPVTIEPEEVLNFPPHLQIYTFEQGNISEFTPPVSGLTNVLGYYLMDASSILPVLVLNLRPGDAVLDMCAAPGGKSLVCIQTLYPDLVVCNDSSKSRIGKLKYVMQQYLYDWEKRVTITNDEGTVIQDKDIFSKILVDVPCTNDRLSLIENDNSIFKPSRNKERILLPQLQVELLFNALKLVKVGGCVVYSTCSLNPAQNDGVVQMALRRVWEETEIKVIVKDLKNVLEPARILFQFAEPHTLRYGSLVVPYLPSNFGPMYFCKLERVH